MRGKIIEKFTAVSCALLLAGGVMGGVVFAGGVEAAEETAEPAAAFVILEPVIEETSSPVMEVVDNRTSVPIYINGEEAGACPVVEGELFMSPAAFCRVLGLDMTEWTEGGVCKASGGGVTFSAEPGALYFICNERYFYVEGGVRSLGGKAAVPLELLAKCLGVTAAWDRVGWSVAVGPEKIVPLESGETYYVDTDVYWLSHVIYAEAGNQPLLGQIAVGSVVMNRIADPAFVGQNSVYDVIFAKNQFEVVINGMIYMEPDNMAVLAAKLALEGADAAGGATYFATFDFGEGYECVMWIGDHCFMTEA